MILEQKIRNKEQGTKSKDAKSPCSLLLTQIKKQFKPL